jgi:hypothetical protein
VTGSVTGSVVACVVASVTVVVAVCVVCAGSEGFGSYAVSQAPIRMPHSTNPQTMDTSIGHFFMVASSFQKHFPNYSTFFLKKKVLLYKTNGMPSLSAVRTQQGI